VDGFAVAIASAANTIGKVPKVKTGKVKPTNGSALGFEATLWATAGQAGPAPKFADEYNGGRAQFASPRAHGRGRIRSR